MPRWSPFEPYFWSLVNKTDTCWVWKGNVDSKGYGRVHHEGKRQRAHRVAYKLLNHPIPSHLLACHHCDNKLCVNPDHIFIGTHKDNMQDWTKKGKNRLANDKSLWSNGKHMQGDSERAKEIRASFSEKRKQEFKEGRRQAIRNEKGQIVGTTMK